MKWILALCVTLSGSLWAQDVDVQEQLLLHRDERKAKYEYLRNRLEEAIKTVEGLHDRAIQAKLASENLYNQIQRIAHAKPADQAAQIAELQPKKEAADARLAAETHTLQVAMKDVQGIQAELTRTVSELKAAQARLDELHVANGLSSPPTEVALSKRIPLPPERPLPELPSPKPGFDCYGDPLPYGVIARMGTVRFNAESTNHLAVSPDGRYLATHSRGDVDIWTRDGRRYSAVSLPEHRTECGILLFSPDSSCVLVGLQGQSLAVWKVDGGQLVWERDLSDWLPAIEHAAFSPDGQRVVVGFERRGAFVAILDSLTGAVRQEIAFPGHVAPAVAWSADGRTVAACALSKAQLIPLENPDAARSIRLPKDNVGPFAWVQEAGLIVLQHQHDLVRVIDVNTGEVVSTIEERNSINRMILAPDSKTLYLFFVDGGWRARCRVAAYDLLTRKVLREFRIDVDMAASMASATITPDGRFFVTGQPEVRWWSTVDGRPIDRRERHSGVAKLTFDPTGKTLYSLGGAIRAWEVKTGRPTKRFELNEEGMFFSVPIAMALSPDGRCLAASDAQTSVSIVNTVTGEVRTGDHGRSGAQDLAITPDGKSLIQWSGWIEVFELRDGERLGKPRHLKLVRGALGSNLIISPNGQWLVVNGKDVVIYDLRKLQNWGPGAPEVEEWKPGDPRPSPGVPPAITPDSSTLVFGFDEERDEFLMWRFLEEKYPWEHVRQRKLSPITISSKGLWATSAKTVRGKYSVRLGKWGTTAVYREFCGHRFPITALAFSPDGRYLATGDHSGQILVWDTEVPLREKPENPASEF